ncbi:MAG: hypothetical protein KC414_00040, partial [Romboutsia sp.]|nr:hypothetical protein [Romboutsia sp.]
NNLPEIFSKVTIIKPVPNSSSFFKAGDATMTSAVEEFWGTDINGQKVKLNSIPYEANKFRGTKQIYGVTYNYSKRKWNIIDPEDITKTRLLENNSSFLNTLVRNCKLVNDRIDHPYKGQYIVETDIFDRNDPFFTNAKTRLALEGGEKHLNTTINEPLNVILLLGYIARNEFSLGAFSRTQAKGVNVKYIIVDSNIDKKIKKEKRDNNKKVSDILYSLDYSKKIKLAISFNLISKFNTEEDYVDEVLYDFAMDNVSKFSDNKNITKQQAFLNRIENGVQQVEAYYAFYLGKIKGIIRLQNKAYTAFGKTLGITVTDVITLLLSNNNEFLTKILEACDAKSV